MKSGRNRDFLVTVTFIISSSDAEIEAIKKRRNYKEEVLCLMAEEQIGVIFTPAPMEAPVKAKKEGK